MRIQSIPRIAAIVASALSLSACASGRGYVGGGLVAEDVTYVELNPATGEAVATPRNPLGRATVGYELQPAPQWLLTAEIAHTSSLRTGGDRGVNSASLSVRWFPFGR